MAENRLKHITVTYGPCILEHNKRQKTLLKLRSIITSPPTHSVGARLVTVAGVCRHCLLHSHMQRNSPGGSTHGEPVVLRPVRATPRFICLHFTD